MINKFIYKNIFMYASLQFCGNIEEYFAHNTEKLLVYLVMPRLKNKYNLLRTYSKGKLIKEEKVWSSENIFLYYFSWFFYHNYFLLTRFNRKEKINVIAGHLVCFFGMDLLKKMRNITYTYWIGDYFPGSNIIIQMYEKIKQYYHNKVTNACYLSDGINRIFNDNKIVNSFRKKTIMWGVKPKNIKRKLPQKSFTILFIGLIKDSQGLEFLFDFLKHNKNYFINIIGICDSQLYKKYQQIIKKNNITSSVFFPNKFFSDEELFDLSKSCHVGIALYNADKSNPTYYTDPGKVKSYAEYGLPVIMSNVSAVAEYVKKYKSGILIDRNVGELINAIQKIKKNYKQYKHGLEKFNNHFFYETYYLKLFAFLEE